MMKLLKSKPLFTWIACFAILLNALAPSISHAVNASRGALSPMMEICTVSGVQSITEMPGMPAGDDSGQGGASSAKHCPFCLQHAGSFALAPAETPTRAIADGHELFPSLFYHAPHRLFSWTAANPRGPPLAS